MTISEITLRELEPKRFIAEQVESLRSAVGGGKAAVALSGGVDSAVVTLLAHRALGPRLLALAILHEDRVTGIRNGRREFGARSRSAAGTPRTPSRRSRPACPGRHSSAWPSA